MFAGLVVITDRLTDHTTPSVAIGLIIAHCPRVPWTMDSDTRDFVVDLGRKIARVSGDDREVSFLFQHISVLFRFNSALLFDSFELGDRLEL